MSQIIKIKIKMNIIILTGNEIRHKYFRIFISNNPKINVLVAIAKETNIA